MWCVDRYIGLDGFTDFEYYFISFLKKSCTCPCLWKRTLGKIQSAVLDGHNPDDVEEAVDVVVVADGVVGDAGARTGGGHRDVGMEEGLLETVVVASDGNLIETKLVLRLEVIEAEGYLHGGCAVVRHTLADVVAVAAVVVAMPVGDVDWLSSDRWEHRTT